MRCSSESTYIVRHNNVAAATSIIHSSDFFLCLNNSPAQADIKRCHIKSTAAIDASKSQTTETIVFEQDNDDWSGDFNIFKAICPESSLSALQLDSDDNELSVIIDYVEDSQAMSILMGYFTRGTNEIMFDENLAQKMFNIAAHLRMSADEIDCLFQIVHSNLMSSKIDFEFQKVDNPANADSLRSSFLPFQANGIMCLIEVEFEPVENVIEYAIEIIKCVGEDDVIIYQAFFPSQCMANGRISVQFDKSILIYPNKEYHICLRNARETVANFAQGNVFGARGIIEVEKGGKKHTLGKFDNYTSKFSKLVFYPVP